MSPPQFGKIGSKVKDLLSKKYTYHQEIKVCSKADGGLKLEACGTDAGKDGLAGYTTLKYKDKAFGEAEATLHTSGDVKDTKGKIKFDKFQKGADVSISSSAALAPTVEANYKQDNIATNLKLTTDGKKSSLFGSASYGMEGITLALSGKTTDFSSLKDYNAAAEYQNKDVTLSLVTADKCEKVTVSYFQKWTKSLEWGAKMQLLPASNLLTVGTEYELDKHTTLKSMASTDGKVACAVQHKVKDPEFKMNLAAAFDTNKGLQAQKFGVSLTFGDD